MRKGNSRKQKEETKRMKAKTQNAGVLIPPETRINIRAVLL